MTIKNGSLFIFRLFGVNVYLHWSWGVAAVLEIGFLGNRGIGYQTAVYLSLFLIVLTHEFGHALACKSVGGIAEEIVLWPLGGIAYVQPPQRAGAYLWSIVAGPLVNFILVPLTLLAYWLAATSAPASIATDFLRDLASINAGLLIFNMLPFYPLDGGQTLRGLIWFVAGRGLSLIIAASIGLIGACALGLAALLSIVLGAKSHFDGYWFGFMAVFLGSRSYRSIRLGLQLYKLERLPRREEASCPKCRQHPPQGELWTCPCGKLFDTFESGAVCPHCGQGFQATACPYCHESSPLALWYPQRAVAVARPVLGAESRGPGTF